jgi:hypothetical protein
MIVNSYGATLGEWRQSNYKGSIANFNQQKKNQNQNVHGQDQRNASTPARMVDQMQNHQQHQFQPQPTAQYNPQGY